MTIDPKGDLASYRRRQIFGCLPGILIAVALSVPLMFLPSTKADKAHAPAIQPDSGMACVMLEKLLTPQLKAPSSAQFDYADCVRHATHSGDTWTIYSYVDADNSFGAHIRTHFVAVLSNVPPSDTWVLRSVTFDDP
jgi:hypothetical protein